MYRLYFSKRDKELKIEPIPDSSFMKYKVTDEVTQYNDCYFLCNTRKPLRDKAKEIQAAWVADTEALLQQLKDIKVKNKY